MKRVCDTNNSIDSVEDVFLKFFEDFWRSEREGEGQHLEFEENVGIVNVELQKNNVYIKAVSWFKFSKY